MALVEIQDILQNQVDTEHLLGAHLDLPVRGGTSDVYAFSVLGWVVGRRSRATRIEFLSDGLPTQTLPIQEARPDIAELFPTKPESATSGYATSLSVLGLSSSFKMLVRAVLEDGSRVGFARIQGQRAPIRTSFEPARQPLMVTTLARTGSTWLTHLLSHHAAIVAYRPFQSDPRVATYWLDILRELAEPTSFLPVVSSPATTERRWWLSQSVPWPVLHLPDPGIQKWLGTSSVEQLAAFCQQQVETFYQQVAQAQCNDQAQYFVEKFQPLHVPEVVWELYPKSKEIILVRDFRDMLCSMHDYFDRPDFADNSTQIHDPYRDLIERLSRDGISLLHAWNTRRDHSCLVRYEDLITQPDRTLESVLTYLEIASDPATIRQTLQHASSDMAELQRLHQTSAGPAASIGRWRRDLPSQLKELARESFGAILAGFGYA